MRTKLSPIFSIAQIRQCEKNAESDLKLDSDTLMRRAGSAAFAVFREHFKESANIAVFVGNGNNGGDGYVFAELCHLAMLDVCVWQVGDHSHLSGAALQAYQTCQASGVTIKSLKSDSDYSGYHVMVDAICGIGLKTELREDVIDLLKKIESLKRPIFAIDIPTGVDADTGCILGYALHADVTITFIGLKLGLLTGQGVSYSGTVICSDLEIDDRWLAKQPLLAEEIDLFAFHPYFKKRAKDWHKGLSGHVLVIGGDYGFVGAPEMAALAALRVGAGLVSIATRVEYAEKMAGLIPEIMCHGVTDVASLLPLLEKADVVVIGPGLGTSRWAKTLLDKVLVQNVKKVVDADGLNLLAQKPMKREDWILTPHPGEASRLLECDTKKIQSDRLAAVHALNAKFGGVAILKGAGSLIAEEGMIPAICTLGNPGMATAGMGDVLSGVLGGLLAQGMPLFIAAKVGAALHAYAGDLAAKEGSQGMIATDLMPFLRKIVNEIIDADSDDRNND